MVANPFPKNRKEIGREVKVAIFPTSQEEVGKRSVVVQEDLKSSIVLHLEGQHDQADHGRKNGGDGKDKGGDASRRTLTEDDVDVLRDRWNVVNDEAPYEYQEGLQQFSSNGPDSEGGLELRAAFVAAGGADPNKEYVAEPTAWEEDEEGNPVSPVAEIVPSDEMMQGVDTWFREVHDAKDPALDRKVTLYRGIAGGSGMMGGDEAEVNVVSSWMRSPEIAGRFGQVVETDVELREIIDEGSIGEDEFYVYTPEQERAVRVTEL